MALVDDKGTPSALLAGFQAGLGRRLADDEQGPALAALTWAERTARAANPGIRCDPEAFGRALAGCLSPGAQLASIETLHVADLWLARAAADGSPEALAVFDVRIRAATATALARFQRGEAFSDEVAQLLRQRLLLPGAEGRARIGEYAARGALSRWLGAAALRLAINLLESRREDRQAPESALAALESPEIDPELALLRRRYGPALKTAFEDVLGALPVRERNLLRLYFVQGLTVEEIGKLEGAHKSTISRSLTRLRARVLAEVRRVLAERLALRDSELDSLVVALRSELQVSVIRALS